MNSLGYGKVAQTAIAAVSHLAIYYDDGQTLYKAGKIAEDRNLSKPLVAKVLSTLAQTHFVKGVAGAKGGYALDLPPEEITFHEIVSIFEKVGEKPFCPFGPGWCNSHAPCTVHHQIEQMHEAVIRFLKETDFGMIGNPEV